MKIFPKILLIGMVGILVAASVGVISVWSGLKRREYRADEYLYRDFRSILRDAQIAHMNWLKTMTDAMIEKNPEFTVGIDGHLCEFGKWYYLPETEATVNAMPQDIQDAYKGLAADHLKVHELGGEMIELWKKGEIEQCYTLFNDKINPTVRTLLGNLIALEDLCAREVTASHDRGEWLVKLQDIPTYASLVIGFLILGPFCYFTARSIVTPLTRSEDVLMSIVDEGQLNVEISEKTLARKDEIGELVHSIKHVLNDYKSIVALAERLADGDWQVEVKKKSEHDDLNDSLGDMLDHVNGVLLEISACTNKLDKASDDVSEAATSLTSGSQESAASLEQITASMNEISGQTRKNAQSADEAHDLALQASQAAVKGHAVMQEMVNAMQRITENSNEIQRVIKVIDDIAFQTNLLALNAAVEAARAGQHGKGFAVVAEEVRNLASRSAKAAKETSELITKSGQEIVKGNEEATRTSEVLNTIVEQIKKTTDLVSGIAVASKEQAEGVNQISIGLTQIDTVTQQNTAATEEASSAAQEMASMATNLKELVSRFKLRQV